MVANSGLLCHHMTMKIGAFELEEPLPELKDTHVLSLLVPWVDAGSVGTMALSKLESHFDSRELGKLTSPGTYFDFTRYRPITHNVDGERKVTIPNSHIFYARREDGPDLVFLHLLEPHSNAEEYIESISEILKLLNVKRYCRIGGTYGSVPHTRPLRVTGSPGTEKLEELKGLVTPRMSNNYQGPISIMGLISDELERDGIETLSLMVQLPHYLEVEEDHAGAARLMQVICALYGLPGHLADPEEGLKQYMELNEEIEEDPEVREMVLQMEAAYDARAKMLAEELSPPPLPPQVDQFLRDLDRRFDDR